MPHRRVAARGDRVQNGRNPLAGGPVVEMTLWQELPERLERGCSETPDHSTRGPSETWLQLPGWNPTSPPSRPGLSPSCSLVLANAFFVAAEFALVGARRTRLDEMAKGGDGKARLARRAVQSLTRYISATQLGITLASLGLGWVGEPALARVVEGAFTWLPATTAKVATHGLAVAISFTIISVLHIILGELVPKAIALLYPEEVSRWLTAPLMGFAWIMALPIWFLNGTANGILRLAHIKRSSEHDRLHSPEEIRLLVEQSQEAGSLQREDARLLEGVFEFTEKTAEEVMTPRTEIVALEADLTVGAGG